MVGRKLVLAAALSSLALLGSSALGGNCSSAPPAIVMYEGTVNGKPALCVELTDPDGAADLLGYGFDYVLSDGTVYSKPLAIFLWVYGKKGLASSSVTNGKLLCFTKLPGNVVALKARGTDKAFNVATTVGNVPPSITAGNPTFGVKR